MYRFEFVPAGSAAHLSDWATLQAVPTPPAAVHAPYPVLGDGEVRALWCRVIGPRAQTVTGAVLSLARSRKLPLVHLGRVHFATPLLLALGAPGLRAWLDVLRQLPGGPSVLSVHVYAVEPTQRAQAERLLTDAGFAPEAESRTFHDSLLVPVHGTSAQRLERLSYAARRGIRQVSERGYRVAPVTDSAAAPRLSWLTTQAHVRTGGRSRALDSVQIIESARQLPSHAVVFGVYHPERPVATSLVGFAHAYRAGQSVVYASAGTERAADIGSTPLSYGVVAQLLEWTAAVGCELFDFGGITPLDAPDHPLAGISEFKRKFRGVEARVASDFTLPLRPAGAALLRMLEGPARLLRRS